MEFLPIIALVILLYARTLNYNYIIDDYVKREGYYNLGLVQPPIQIFFMKPSQWYRVFMIGMHIVNAWVIYLLWGFYPALLFAVSPMSVWGTAWVTGNYYATAAYFTLIAYFLVHTYPNPLGALASLPFYYAGINSTVCPLAFPFLVIFEPWLATWFVMLVWFIRGDRMKEALRQRNIMFKSAIPPDKRRPILMTKVVARYTFEAILPLKTYMFSKFGATCRDDKKELEALHVPDGHFWASLALVVFVLALGLMVNPFGTCWFFFLIMLHSQWNITGQFYAQRYLYLAQIGMILTLVSLWQAVGGPWWVMAAWFAFYVYKAALFIPKFENQAIFLENDIRQCPDNEWAYSNLANFYSRIPGNEHDAEIERLLRLAEKCNPDHWTIQFNLAKMCYLKKDYPEALQRVNLSIGLCDEEDVQKALQEAKRQMRRAMRKLN